jgi:glycosyltransferase involved in cell wall biosynthesis
MTSNPTRLLLFNLRTDADDGVLGFTTDWINALADRVESIDVISTEVGRLAVRPNVTVRGIGRDRGAGKLGQLLNLYRETWKILRTRRIDGCFAHMNFLFPLLTSPLLKLHRLPIVIWYAHGSVPPLLKYATFIADRMVASSPSGFQLPTPKLRIIGQGIDVDRFAPAARAPRPGFKLLTLGRISRVKRIEVVVDAIARLRETSPELDIRCDLIGAPLNDDGRAYQQEIEARISAAGLSDQVRLLPGVPFHRAHEIVAQADLFVNSGDTDSVDKTVLEALSCGVPVVTSNAAFLQVLPPEMHALSTVPKNDVAQLADRIRAVLTLSPADRAALVERGRRLVVEEHSIGALADKILDQLRQVMASRTR